MAHERHCPLFCPYPDLEYISPGGGLPKCRGGDCTLCDEIDEEFCTCAIIKAVRADVIAQAVEAVQSVPFFWPNEKKRTYIRKKDAIKALEAIITR